MQGREGIMRNKISLLLLGLGLSTISQAQIFKFDLINSTYSPSENAQLRAELQKIENEVNDGLPSNSNANRFMEGMANSSVYASKGIATDYATDFDLLVIGASVGVGADLEKDSSTDSDFSGVGLAPGLVLGFNVGNLLSIDKIGDVEMDRLSIMLNFMKYDYENKEDGIDEASISSFGFMASYKWLDGNDSRTFGWGGVRLHTGYQYNSIDFKFSKNINEAYNVNMGSGSVNTTVTGNPFGALEVATHTIPVEISSDVRFLYIMSLYGGLGMDYSWGSADAQANSNVDDTNIGSACGTGTCSATIRTSGNLNGNSDADPLSYRAFLGLQMNLPFVRIFVQGNKSLSNDLAAGALGIRIAI